LIPKRRTFVEAFNEAKGIDSNTKKPNVPNQSSGSENDSDNDSETSDTSGVKSQQGDLTDLVRVEVSKVD
jgi:hypothetical protein